MRAEMRYIHSLSFKIISAVFIVLVFVLSLITYYNINVQSKHLYDTITLSAASSSNFIKKSMHYTMMINHREDLWQSIKNIGAEPGIERIRIYNKVGRIMFSTKTDEVETLVDKNTESCVMCHGNSQGFTRNHSDQYTRVYQSPRGYRVLGLINPIKNERDCSDADCHAHSQKETILGVLDVQLSLDKYDTYISQSSMALIGSSIVMLLAVVLVSGIFILRVVQRPIKKFIVGTNAIASGNLNHRIILDTRDELGELAISFNAMMDDLKQARAELTRWSETLVDKVEEKTNELRKVQAQIIHMEKMASLGKLGASIAHEINNPLSGILTFARLIQKQIRSNNLSPDKIEKILNEISMIADEAKRCGEIVKDLMFFSRKQDGEHKRHDFNQIIEKSIHLVQHRLDLQQIRLEQNLLTPSPSIECDSSHIQQALMALLVNALEAMPDGGKLIVETSQENPDAVKIAIADTGCGIPESDLDHVFEPFFTTKSSASGVGLGLSIVYGIVQNHNGEIHVASKQSEGTKFTLTLPLHSTLKKTSIQEEKS